MREAAEHVRSAPRSASAGPGRTRLPSFKVVLFTLVVAALSGVVGFAVSREAAPPAQDIAASRLELPTPRPARATSEQTYVEALWPIHTNVERAAVRVALGASFYKLQDLDRAELKTRLEDALAAYRTADQRLRTLQPPQSLASRQEAYLNAVQLFEQSTVEMLRMYEDGSDEHLARGFPLSVQGSDKIREVGQEFWPDEYPPN
ncbi:MAG: hypothetical protein M3069_20675 [Chloroflexota bacterium]|nr:hypothetical protein [Chloroflexota bacterium]